MAPKFESDGAMSALVIGFFLCICICNVRGNWERGESESGSKAVGKLSREIERNCHTGRQTDKQTESKRADRQTDRQTLHIRQQID